MISVFRTVATASALLAFMLGPVLLGKWLAKWSMKTGVEPPSLETQFGVVVLISLVSGIIGFWKPITRLSKKHTKDKTPSV